MCHWSRMKNTCSHSIPAAKSRKGCWSVWMEAPKIMRRSGRLSASFSSARHVTSPPSCAENANSTSHLWQVGRKNEMRYLLIYDISHDGARLKVADACLDYGLERIQFSAFLGELTHAHQRELLLKIKKRLGKHGA